MKTDAFRFAFADDGRPAVLSTLPGNEAVLDTRNPGPGFYLQGPDRKRTPLKDVTVNAEGDLIARSAVGNQEVVFKVGITPRYLAFRIDSVKGIPATRGTSLHFELNANARACVTELDYMTRVQNLRYGVRVHWESIWCRSKANPLGGFALFVVNDEKEGDDTLLRIWVNEKLAHPKIDGEWTLERARAWVADWQRRFADRSQLVAEGESIADLEALLPYAERAGIKEIYLFTNTWRTDPFWPNVQTNWHVNRKVFPRGEKDLLAFSEKVAQKGMRLNLHYVSGGIGPRDPVYVGTKPDRRLACWVRGSLVKAVDPNAKELVFKPAEPTTYPPDLPHFSQHNHVRIEDEIIQVGSFEATGAGGWTLKNCRRGQFLTKATDHASGAEAVGLVVPYGQNYVPDNDSTLLDEIAKNYAGLINRCKIGHTEYDGAEIHAYNGRCGWRMKTKRTNYARVGWCKLGLGYLPPKSKASVTVKGLKALAEIPAVLTDPVIHVGAGTMSVKGRVFSGQILAWQGGGQAIVYDENWKKLRQLPVERKDYVMTTGSSPVSIRATGSNAKPWLEVQFMTEGEPMLVPTQ